MFSIADMSFLHWVLVSVYLFWTPTDSFGQMKGSFFEDILDVFFVGLDQFCSLLGIFIFCQRTSYSAMLLA